MTISTCIDTNECRNTETVPEAFDTAILSQARIINARMGDTIVRQGDRSDQFFLLASGYLFIAQNAASGEENVLRVVGPGELFGITRENKNETYPTSGYAATNCKLYAWKRNHISRYCTASSAFRDQLIAQLTERIFSLQNHAQLLATRSAKVKIAGIILSLAERAGAKTGDVLEIPFPLTRAQIAQMSGTTLHTTSRTMRALQKAGVLGGTRRKILVCDMGRLKQQMD